MFQIQIFPLKFILISKLFICFIYYIFISLFTTIFILLSKRRQTSLQKAIYYKTKDRILERRKTSIEKCLKINMLHTDWKKIFKYKKSGTLFFKN